ENYGPAMRWRVQLVAGFAACLYEPSRMSRYSGAYLLRRFRRTGSRTSAHQCPERDRYLHGELVVGCDYGQGASAFFVCERYVAVGKFEDYDHVRAGWPRATGCQKFGVEDR